MPRGFHLMTSVEEKLLQAMDLFENACAAIIIEKEINNRMKRVKFRLVNGAMVFIQYNNYNQYSYSLIFSPHEQDLCRFDNYDQTWAVSSSPHHFHPRHQFDAIESPMQGDPIKDIPLFCTFITNNLA